MNCLIVESDSDVIWVHVHRQFDVYARTDYLGWMGGKTTALTLSVCLSRMFLNSVWSVLSKWSNKLWTGREVCMKYRWIPCSDLYTEDSGILLPGVGYRSILLAVDPSGWFGGSGMFQFCSVNFTEWHLDRVLRTSTLYSTTAQIASNVHHQKYVCMHVLTV